MRKIKEGIEHWDSIVTTNTTILHKENPCWRHLFTYVDTSEMQLVSHVTIVFCMITKALALSYEANTVRYRSCQPSSFHHYGLSVSSCDASRLSIAKLQKRYIGDKTRWPLLSHEESKNDATQLDPGQNGESKPVHPLKQLEHDISIVLTNLTASKDTSISPGTSPSQLIFNQSIRFILKHEVKPALLFYCTFITQYSCIWH